MASAQRIVVVLAVLLASLPQTGATHQDDAGTGGDAPEDAGAAPLLALGTYSAALAESESDEMDVFRFDVPDGSELHVSISAITNDVVGKIVDEDGSVLARAKVGTRAVSIAASGEVVAFSLEGWSTSALYVFTASTVVPAPQNDARIGADAPDVVAAAIDRPLAGYDGLVSYAEGDNLDTYRVSAPRGSGLDIRFRSLEGNLSAALYYDDGRPLMESLAASTPRGFQPGSTGSFRLSFGTVGNEAGLVTGAQARYNFTAALVSPQNDAGLGEDAPETKETAALIAHANHSGRLEPSFLDRQDWYLLPHAGCEGLSLAYRATLGAPRIRVYGGAGQLLTDLATATSWKRWETFDAGPYHLSVVHAASAQYGSHPVRISQNDADSGCDAGNTSAQAYPVPIANFTGSLRPLADPIDWYAFPSNGCDGIEVVVNTSALPARARVYEPNGTLVAERTTVVQGGTVLVATVLPGAHRLSLDGATALGYAIAASSIVQDDGGTGCDAPGHMAQAVTLASGDHEGDLLRYAGDASDWYRVDTTSCSAARLSFRATSEGELRLAVRSATGEEFHELLSDGDEDAALVVGGPIYLEVSNASAIERASYSIDLEIAEVPVDRCSLGPVAVPFGDLSAYVP